MCFDWLSGPIVESVAPATTDRPFSSWSVPKKGHCEAAVSECADSAGGSGSRHFGNILPHRLRSRRCPQVGVSYLIVFRQHGLHTRCSLISECSHRWSTAFGSPRGVTPKRSFDATLSSGLGQNRFSRVFSILRPLGLRDPS